MIVNIDARGLEWVVGTYLSKDQVAKAEIVAGIDQHTLNQKAFKLPTRLIAKTFVFRLMYGGSAYSYSVDPDFTGVSTSEKFWQGVINHFYDKYYGLAKWHVSIVQEAMKNGFLIMPTGRKYIFSLKTNYKGELEAPETIIKNYPVQGLGADIMAIARVSFFKRFKESKIVGNLINTVHDSVVLDISSGADLPRIIDITNSVFQDIPTNFKRLFGVEFDLPLQAEVSYGQNMKELQEIPFSK